MSIAKIIFLKMKSSSSSSSPSSSSSSSSSAAAKCACGSTETNKSTKSGGSRSSFSTTIRRSSSLNSLSSLSSIGAAARRRSSTTRRRQLLTVADLLEDRDWETLREYLGTDDRARDDVLSDATTLHDACRVGAPADVIYTISVMDPDARRRADSYGRTPLHIACGAYRDDSDAGIMYPNPPNGDVIDYLCGACDDHPSMINDEDEDGCAPLEYAILNNVRFKTVDRMRKASEKAWKAAAAAAEEEQQSGSGFGGTAKASSLMTPLLSCDLTTTRAQAA